MDISQLPLNALRAFEAAARHASFTRAGMELRVSQTAVSHQVKALEKTLGTILFKRLSRGLVLTDEGKALVPVLTDAFRRVSATLGQFKDGRFREILTVGVVGTFATGWLLPHVNSFLSAHPNIDLRIKANNNRSDVLLDGLDLFIRYGDGAWHGTESEPLMDAPLSAVIAPSLCGQVRQPSDLLTLRLLRSYRDDEWERWFAELGLESGKPGGWMFDSSLALVEAAALGVGAALVPTMMFKRDLDAGRIVQPFAASVSLGRYWLTRLKSHPETQAMRAFRDWLMSSL